MGYQSEKKFDDIFSRFDTIRVCDGGTRYALGGSFKLVTLATKTNCKGHDSTAQGNKRMGTHKQIKKHK